MLVHPTRRQISIDCICKLDLALRRTRTEIVSANTKDRGVFFLQISIARDEFP